jgi:GntR family transcriptional repressor for pyruvate dehydrogenase complex
VVQFGPLERTTLHEQIVEKIKAMIEDGTLKPGDSLPSERQLARDMEVSRIPVREALKMLEFMGVIEIRHGRAAVVRGLGQAAMIDTINLVLESGPNELHEMNQARMILEVGAVRLACEKRTDADIAHMREILDRMEAEIDDGCNVVDTSMEFHMAIMRATKNKILCSFMMLFRDLLRESRSISLSRPERPREALSEHKAILQAVVDRDSALAASAMEIHIKKHFVKPGRRSPRDTEGTSSRDA